MLHINHTTNMNDMSSLKMINAQKYFKIKNNIKYIQKQVDKITTHGIMKMKDELTFIFRPNESLLYLARADI